MLAAITLITISMRMQYPQPRFVRCSCSFRIMVAIGL